MNYLRKASFGDLFVVTFTVAATFQLAAGLLGIVFAFLAPGSFNLNGRPATSVAEALAALLIIVIMMLVINAAISAMGSGLWLMVRKLPFIARRAA